MTTPRESLTPGDPVQPLYLLLRCASCMGKTEHKADSRGLYWCTQCPASRSAPAAISPPSTTVAAAIVELEAARPAGGGNGDARETCEDCGAAGDLHLVGHGVHLLCRDSDACEARWKAAGGRLPCEGCGRQAPNHAADCTVMHPPRAPAPAVEAPACLPGDVPPEVVQHPGYATALRARIGELEAECAEWRVRALKAEDRLARAVVILMSPTEERKP